MTRSACWTSTIVCSLIACCGSANVVLPSIFSDNMVIQRNAEVVIWGWAKPLEEVTVKTSWDSNTYSIRTPNDASWKIIVRTPDAGGPYSIEIKGYNRVLLNNVMVGEVWLCSGQSNMEWTARMGIDNAEHEIAAARYPDIRFITIDHRTAMAPQLDVSASPWAACTPQTMQHFSAVAYFFARSLQQELNIPIGLINSSWGGTPAESWVIIDHCENATLIEEAASLLRDVPWGPNFPAAISYAMISPLRNYRIAGAIYYQGEENVHNAQYYHRVFPSVITSWRNAWGYSFPFYFVQIAPYNGYPADGGVRIRDAQRRALALPGTGMVVTSDIGDVEDIHPANKQDVGLRLAGLALRRTYGLKASFDSGPLYRSHEIRDGRIIVHFENAEGLYAEDSTLDLFEVAGEDGLFRQVTAQIQDDAIILSTGTIDQPVAIRFAWSNTAEPALFNNAHLPASCFTTE